MSLGERWSWLKRFRVWEAMRRIFLYAENWLEAENRDDQSPPSPPEADPKQKCRSAERPQKLG
jgi:hypothetical protein